ncbi:MAG: hypothetical protein JWP97_5755 [Labilithrix sp.]|nr:hypothetical protein [Labilithrix sp.]
MMAASPLSVRGAYVSLESVPWLAELSTQDTPESLMIEREEAAEGDEVAEQDYVAIRELSEARLKGYLACIPPSEALALMLHLGLLGYPPTFQYEIAETLGVKSKQLVSYMVRRARVRILYLASRPAIDVKVLARAISPAQLAVVADVYATASFTEAARRRWVCPADRIGKRRHDWTRAHAKRVKREFFRSVAKIERRPELSEQLAALLHLVAHLGSLSHHTGKGSWWTP